MSNVWRREVAPVLHEPLVEELASGAVDSELQAYDVIASRASHASSHRIAQ